MTDVWLVFHFKSNAQHARRVKQLLLDQRPALADQGFPGSRVYTTYGAYDALLLVAAETASLSRCRRIVNRLASDLAHKPDIWLKEVGEWVLWSGEDGRPPSSSEVERFYVRPEQLGGYLAFTFVKLRPFQETSCAAPILAENLLQFVHEAVGPGDLSPGVRVARFNHFGWADLILALSHSDATLVTQLAMAIRGHWAVRSSGTYLGMDCAAGNDFPDGCDGDIHCAFNNGEDFARFIQSHVGAPAAGPTYRVALGRFDLVTGLCSASQARAALAGLGSDGPGAAVVESSTMICVPPSAEARIAKRLAQVSPPPEVRPLRLDPEKDLRSRILLTREHLWQAVNSAVERHIIDQTLAAEALAVAELIDVSCGAPHVHDSFIDVVNSFWRFVASLELQLCQLGCPVPTPFLAEEYGFRSGPVYERDTPDWCDARATLYTEVSWALHYYYRSALHRHRGGLDSLFYPQLGQTIARSSLHRLLAVCDEIVTHVFPRADFWQEGGYHWGGHICLSERAGVRSFRLMTYDIVGIPYRGSIALLGDLGILTTVLIHEAAHMVYQGVCQIAYKLSKIVTDWPAQVRCYKDDLRVLAVYFADCLNAASHLAPPPPEEVEGVRPELERTPRLTPELWSDLHLLRVIAPRDEWVSTFLSLARDEFVLFDRAEHSEIIHRLFAAILAQNRTYLESRILQGQLIPVTARLDTGEITTAYSRTWAEDLDQRLLSWMASQLPHAEDYPELSNLLNYARSWLKPGPSAGKPGRALAGLFAVVRSTMDALDALMVTEFSPNFDAMVRERVPAKEPPEQRYRRFRALLRHLWRARGPVQLNPPCQLAFDKMYDIVAYERCEQFL